MDAPVTLVEYGDFECPHCGRAHYILNEVEDEMGPELRIVYRHFPLTTIHPHAEAAALAAEAAGAQEKFWEMHDLLFVNQDALEEEDLWQYARALDLDLTKFDEDMSTRKYLPRIKEDFMSGVRSGVNGTPTFFINGVRHEGSFEYPVLVAALKQAAEVKAHH
jgi:protein-disulfide isomerase